MTIMLQLKYDELRAIAKQCRDCGEDITLLFTKTRDRAQDLRGMWKGDAADKFFEEMDLVLLPPLKQTGVVLFAMQDVLLKVIKYVYEADQDTAKFFKQDVGFLGGFTGVGVAAEASGGIVGINLGVRPHVGAGVFAGQQGIGSAGVESSGSGITGGPVPGGRGDDGGNQQSPMTGSTKETHEAVGGGGGMGGSSGSQGWAGRTGSTMGGAGHSTQVGSTGSQAQPLNPPIQPDHVYESSNAGGTSQAGSQQSTASVIGEVEKKETGAQVGAAAATAAGGAGMAAVGKGGLRSGKKFSKNRRLNQ